MSREPAKSLPKYRCHKGSGRAVVTLCDHGDGRRKDVYLGRFNTADSKRKYDSEIAAWLARGRRLAGPGPAPSALTVNEALLKYIEHLRAKSRKPDGSETGHVAYMCLTARYLREMFGEKLACDLGVGDLEQLRDKLIADGRVCTAVTKHIRQARIIFKWWLRRRLIPRTGWDTLEEMKDAVPTIHAGQFGAKPGREVLPADPRAVEAALPFLPAMPRAIVRLLQLTGCRPSEILSMTPGELDRSGEPWLLRPRWHKLARKGKRREIPLGAQARAVLSPWLLGVAPNERVFTAQRSEQKRQRERGEARATPRWPSHLARNEAKRKAKPARTPGDCYRHSTLRTALRRACLRAGVAPIAPYQLRHLKATETQLAYGLEAAAAVLGDSLATAAGYTKRAQHALALRVAAEVG
jgi:integrase